MIGTKLQLNWKYKNQSKFFSDFKKNLVFIYGFRKLGTKTYFYVGSTREHPEVRALRHLRDAKKNKHENLRLASLLLTTHWQIDIIDLCSEKERWKREYEWIQKFLAERHKLVNSRNPISPRQPLIKKGKING